MIRPRESLQLGRGDQDTTADPPGSEALVCDETIQCAHRDGKLFRRALAVIEQPGKGFEQSFLLWGQKMEKAAVDGSLCGHQRWGVSKSVFGLDQDRSGPVFLVGEGRCLYGFRSVSTRLSIRPSISTGSPDGSCLCCMNIIKLSSKTIPVLLPPSKLT